MIKIKKYMVTIGIGVVLLSGCGKKQVETTTEGIAWMLRSTGGA